MYRYLDTEHIRSLFLLAVLQRKRGGSHTVPTDNSSSWPVWGVAHVEEIESACFSTQFAFTSVCLSTSLSLLNRVIGMIDSR